MDSEDDFPCYQVPRPDQSDIPSTPMSPNRLPIPLPSSIPTCVRVDLDRTLIDSCFHSQRKESTRVDPKSFRQYCSAPEPLQNVNFDKDASWNSSMESILEEQSPRKDFNTIEKETFFPQTKIVNGTEIQPRALWPASSTESLEVRPLDSSWERDKETSYEKQSRVSDVCSVFNALKMQLPSKREECPGDPYNFKVPDPKGSFNSPNSCLSPFFSASTPSRETGDKTALFNDEFACSPVISSRFRRSPSPSMFSPKNETEGPSKNAVEPMDRTSNDSVLEVSMCRDPRIGPAPPQPVVNKSPPQNAELDEEKEENSPNCPPKIPPTKITYGSCCDEPTVLEETEAELFEDVIKVEKACRQEKSDKSLPKKPLPTSNGFVTFKAFATSYSDSSLLEQHEGPQNAPSMVEDSNVGICRNGIRTNEARKKLRLEVSAWNTSNPIAGIQADVTDSQLFLAVQDIETSLCAPPTPSSAEQHHKQQLHHHSLHGQVEVQLKIPEVKTPCEKTTDVPVSATSQSSENATKFTGFQTAGNRPVSISKEALAQVHNLFNDCDGDDVQWEAPELNAVENPRAANEKTSNPASLTSAQVQIPSDGCDNKATVEKKSKMVKKRLGFRPGSNTSSSSSSAALTRLTVPELDEVAAEMPAIHGSFPAFRTASNKTCSASFTSVAKAKSILDGCEGMVDLASEKENNPDFGASTYQAASTSAFLVNDTNEQRRCLGFQTASNKAVAISTSAQEKVRDMFKDCDLQLDFPEVNVESAAAPKTSLLSGRFTSAGTLGAAAIPKSSPQSPEVTCKKGYNEVDNGPERDFGGFQTANKNAVTISKAALDRVRHIFSDLENIDKNGSLLGKPLACNNKEETTVVSIGPEKGFGGFQTASKNAVTISKAALDRVRNIFSDLDDNGKNGSRLGQPLACNSEKATEDEVPPGPQRSFGGFQTACKNAVPISKAALDRVNHMFRDIDDEKNGSLGLGKPLANDKETTEEVPNVINVSNDPFGGFQTASKKVVPISKAAVDRVKNIFSDLDDTERNGCVPGKIPSKPKAKSDTPKQESITPDNVVLPKNAHSIANESDLALLEKDLSYFESFEWEETILPPWLVSELNETQNSSSFKSSCKRVSESPIRIGSKRSKIMIDPMREEILNQRKLAREHQAVLIDRKGKVKPIVGTYLQQRLSGRCKPWREMLPQGPRTVTYDESVPDYILQVTYDNCQDFIFDSHNFYKPSEVGDHNGIRESDGFVVIPNDSDLISAEEVERAFLAGPGVAPELIPAGWIRHHYGLIVWKLACYMRSCPQVTNFLTPHHVLMQLKYRYDRELDRCESSALKRILERDDTSTKALVLVVIKMTQLVDGWELLLSDGWYTCPARCDPAMDNIIQKGKLVVGTKIMTVGADLVGCDQGIPPLERPPQVHLKIATNSTRRVQWFRRLGFEKLRKRPPVSIRSILPHGGNIACLHIAVVRIYPLVFMEKQTNGRSVTRSARSEHREAVKFQKEQETCMDKILHDINASGSSPYIYPDDFETISEDARARLHDKVAASRDASFKKMSEMRKERSVRSVLRIRVVDATGDADSSVVLSWWQPSEDVVSGFSEGAFYALYNITPSNSRGSQLYLNTSRQTLVEPLPRGALPLPLRRVLTVSQVSSEAVQLGELDVVGLVVHIDGRPDRPTKTVYLSDNTGYRFFGLVFWNGLQELCCEDILRVGEVVGVSNVQWRQSSLSGRIPLGYVNEVSLFALQSRSRIVQHAIDELKQRLLQEDLPSLVETCKDQIVSSLFASNFPTSNQSLEGSLNRSAVPDGNTSVNQSFGAKKEASSWSSPCATLLRPQAASTPVRPTCQKRIQFLQKFGEAPPLSPIVANVNVCRKPFKPPTRVRNDNT